MPERLDIRNCRPKKFWLRNRLLVKVYKNLLFLQKKTKIDPTLTTKFLNTGIIMTGCLKKILKIISSETCLPKKEIYCAICYNIP